ncbi:hypothetical protein AURDEDRAFT_121863 [Auricularia subglabra TFB-10046 SS5]|nr:hypothetical protein AURDEDRAFT_121863 [Auricularia subglabra TFB-10046 SS5]
MTAYPSVGPYDSKLWLAYMKACRAGRTATSPFIMNSFPNVSWYNTILAGHGAALVVSSNLLRTARAYCRASPNSYPCAHEWILYGWPTPNSSNKSETPHHTVLKPSLNPQSGDSRPQSGAASPQIPETAGNNVVGPPKLPVSDIERMLNGYGLTNVIIGNVVVETINIELHA